MTLTDEHIASQPKFLAYHRIYNSDLGDDGGSSTRRFQKCTKIFRFQRLNFKKIFLGYVLVKAIVGTDYSLPRRDSTQCAHCEMPGSACAVQTHKAKDTTAAISLQR